MRKIYKPLLALPFASILLYASPAHAFAFCPVCSVSLVAGLGLTEYYNVDDTISGLWIGALLMSMTIWTINWLNEKSIRFKFRKILVLLMYYLSVLIPLYYLEFIGKSFNKLWGLDKLILGITAGSIILLIAYNLHTYLHKKNNNKVYFPFQKVVIPIGLILIFSSIFYLITK